VSKICSFNVLVLWMISFKVLESYRQPMARVKPVEEEEEENISKW